MVQIGIETDRLIRNVERLMFMRRLKQSGDHFHFLAHGPAVAIRDSATARTDGRDAAHSASTGSHL